MCFFLKYFQNNLLQNLALELFVISFFMCFFHCGDFSREEVYIWKKNSVVCIMKKKGLHSVPHFLELKNSNVSYSNSYKEEIICIP